MYQQLWKPTNKQILPDSKKWTTALGKHFGRYTNTDESEEAAQSRSDQDVELEISVAAPACPPGWRRKGRQHDSEAYAGELDPRRLWGAWNVAST